MKGTVTTEALSSRNDIPIEGAQDRKKLTISDKKHISVRIKYLGREFFNQNLRTQHTTSSKLDTHLNSTSNTSKLRELIHMLINAISLLLSDLSNFPKDSNLGPHLDKLLQGIQSEELGLCNENL